MKKLFLSALLTLLLIPASFALGFEFDFFTGTGFTAGFTTRGDVFNMTYGVWYDSHDVTKTEEVETGSGYYRSYYDVETEYSNSCVGPYLQFDWSILPFEIAGIVNVGLNLGFKVAALYCTETDFDVALAPMISLAARWKNLDVLLGWHGAAYIHELTSDDYSDSGWVNSFQIGARYVIGGRGGSSGGSSGASSGSSVAGGAPSSGSSGGIRIISGSHTNIRRVQ